MANKRNKRKRLTARDKNIQAWKKEANRIRRWARGLEKSGFKVDLGTALDIPGRITKRRLQQLQSIKRNKLYESFTIHADHWETDAQAYAYSVTGIEYGDILSRKEITQLRKLQREYSPAPGDVPSDPDVDGADIAYENCLKAMEGSPYVEPVYIRAFLDEYKNDKVFRALLVYFEDYSVERCTQAAWDSKDYEREESMYSLFDALRIDVGADAESLTIQS